MKTADPQFVLLAVPSGDQLRHVANCIRGTATNAPNSENFTGFLQGHMHRPSSGLESCEATPWHTQIPKFPLIQTPTGLQMMQGRRALCNGFEIRLWHTSCSLFPFRVTFLLDALHYLDDKASSHGCSD